MINSTLNTHGQIYSKVRCKEKDWITQLAFTLFRVVMEDKQEVNITKRAERNSMGIVNDCHLLTECGTAVRTLSSLETKQSVFLTQRLKPRIFTQCLLKIYIEHPNPLWPILPLNDLGIPFPLQQIPQKRMQWFKWLKGCQSQ